MTDPVRFEPPLDDDVLEDLHWCLETFSAWPTGPDCERVKSQMEGWGRDLLGSVLGGEGAERLWQQFLDANAEDKLLTVDATDPCVLRLPWELLADRSGHLFSAGIGVRRRLREATRSRIRAFALPVRLLVVVCRHEGAGFIDPRAVSLPLLNALDELGARVETEFLYPLQSGSKPSTRARATASSRLCTSSLL